MKEKEKLLSKNIKNSITPAEKVRLKIPYYLIITFASFATIPILSFNISAQEASYLNFLNDTLVGSYIIRELINMPLAPTTDIDIYFRILSLIITSISALIFYRIVKSVTSDFNVIIVALIIFLINPISQISYISVIPFSIIYLFLTVALSHALSGKTYNRIRATILLIVVIIITLFLAQLSYIYILFTLLIFLSILLGYGTAKFFNTGHIKYIVYITIVIFLAINIYIRFTEKSIIFISDNRDYRPLANTVFKSVKYGDTIVMDNIDDVALLNYYLGLNFDIEDIKSLENTKDINNNITLHGGSKLVILKDKASTDIVTDADIVSILSLSDIDDIKQKYYIYRLK